MTPPPEAESDRANQPAYGWACFGLTVLLLVACSSAVVFAYYGACAAGSGPGGWNIHMVFVLPMVAVLGVSITILGKALIATLPFPMWIRALLFALLVTLGAYSASYAL